MKVTENKERKNGNRKYMMYSNKTNQVVKWCPGGSGVITNI